MRHVNVLVFVCAFFAVNADLETSWFGGLRNATSEATNYFSGVVQRQKELFQHVTDTATNYVVNTVEIPKNAIINMKNLTIDYVNSTASKVLDYKLKAYVEKIRTRMPYGIPECGIPILEPLTIKYQDFEVHKEDTGNIAGFVQNVTISHLSTFVVDQARFSLSGPNITLNITVPIIHVTGIYKISGAVGNLFSLNGTGPFNVTLYEAKFYVNTGLGFSQGMYIKSLDIDFSVKAVEIHLRGLLPKKDIEDTICRVLGVIAPEAVEEFKPDILPRIQEYIASKANSTIKHLTLSEMLQILIGQP